MFQRRFNASCAQKLSLLLLQVLHLFVSKFQYHFLDLKEKVPTPTSTLTNIHSYQIAACILGCC